MDELLNSAKKLVDGSLKTPRNVPKTPTPKIPHIPERDPAIIRRRKTKPFLSAGDLKIIAMQVLNKEKGKYRKYLKKLPKIWGGSRQGGSGWSPAWMAAFEVLAEGLEDRGVK